MSEADLRGRVAVVTGAARGIGRAIALAFAGRGADLGLVDVDGEGLTSVREEASGLGVRVESAAADVTDAEAVKETLGGIVKALGRVDVLVNNAGITRDGLMLRMAEGDWDRVIAVNLKGAFLCARFAANQMFRQRSGRIINIASVSGLMGNAGQTNYAASKAGIVGMTKSLARELAPRGITVNAIAPGFIDTDMTAAMPAEARERAVAGVPMGRMGRPEDVAAAALFLAGEGGDYITGCVLRVDGGLAM